MSTILSGGKDTVKGIQTFSAVDMRISAGLSAFGARLTSSGARVAVLMSDGTGVSG